MTVTLSWWVAPLVLMWAVALLSCIIDEDQRSQVPSVLGRLLFITVVALLTRFL